MTGGLPVSWIDPRLEALEAELFLIGQELAAAEARLVDVRTRLAVFTRLHERLLAPWHAQLDEIEARIAELLAEGSRRADDRDDVVRTARVLLGEADPEALTEFRTARLVCPVARRLSDSGGRDGRQSQGHVIEGGCRWILTNRGVTDLDGPCPPGAQEEFAVGPAGCSTSAGAGPFSRTMTVSASDTLANLFHSNRSAISRATSPTPRRPSTNRIRPTSCLSASPQYHHAYR
ncbi:ABC transporter C-terminal domain-containing protein [Virgisporangium aurantiacum]|uniref:Uncharacterized protein n=1 Tax=Virgisporangium aurantiacum TaxID=175570 RepID=A0A8J3ZFE7_9ACTN|nr:ABC transporter C-terminal domain-containing protein [Virgisporangium aurantiacum]GIJ62954.1 hypothetical protein Vau01_104700 [Virgisporangium aurantiacum]